jgi:hypothetical protein
VISLDKVKCTGGKTAYVGWAARHYWTVMKTPGGNWVASANCGKSLYERRLSDIKAKLAEMDLKDLMDEKRKAIK